MALNGGMLEQSGIGLASDSDEDVLVGGDITVGSAAPKPVLQEEVMLDTGDLPESDNSDDDVLNTEKITTGNDEIVDEYKQDVDDVMDDVALNGCMVEQSGIGLASDSDEDVLVGGDITVGSAAPLRSKPVLQEEVMLDTGDLPESDNSDDDVLVGENIGTTRTGGGDGSIALPGQPTIGLNCVGWREYWYDAYGWRRWIDW
eukprot:1161595_1